LVGPADGCVAALVVVGARVEAARVARKSGVVVTVAGVFGSSAGAAAFAGAGAGAGDVVDGREGASGR